jgi:hypothetical protein
VNIPPDEQIAQKIRVIAFVSEQRRKMIEEAPVFVFAPVAPHRHLAGIFIIVEELLGPGIYPN